MRRLNVVGLVGMVVASSWASGQDMFRVSIPTPRPEQLKAILADEGFATSCDSRVDAGALEIIVNEWDLARLQNMNLTPMVIEKGRPFREVQVERAAAAGEPDVPGYPDLATIEQALSDAEAAYPAIAKKVNLTTMLGAPLTHEGRQIYALKISDNVAQDEDEPTYMIVSTHHVREVVTPVIALHAIDQFLTLYGTNQQVTNAVNNNEIWIIPCVNPDGYEYVFNVNNLWRKNRRNNGNGTFGVDLNRNYAEGWNNACSGSTSTSSDTYKGPSPASEPEVQTLIKLSQAKRWARSMDYHSFGSEVLWTYACPDHPFDAWYEQEAIALSQASGYGGQNRPPSADGEEYHHQLVHYGTFAFLTETHTEFQPPYASAQAEAVKLWPGILAQLARPVSVWGHVTDATTGQAIAASVELVGVTFSNGETNGSGGPFGRYQMTVPPGNYTLRFSKTGYFDAVKQVSVTSASSQQVEVELQPEVFGLAFNLPNGLPATVDPAGGTTMRVEVLAANGRTPKPGTGVLHVDTGAGFQSIPMNVVSSNVYDAVFPSATCKETVAFYITAEDTVGQQWQDPNGAPIIGTYEALAISAIEITFADNFQTNKGWAAQNLGATSGDWDRGVPVNDPNWAYDPAADGDGSGACLLTQNAPGNTDVDDGAVRITSPVFDMSQGGDISYVYYLNLTNANGADRLLVEINSSGGSGVWTTIASHTTNGGLSWRPHTITESELAAAGVAFTSQMVLRVTANDDNPQSIVEAGFDGLRVERVVCNQACYADCDQSGSLDLFDFLCFTNAFNAQNPYADCDQSGSLDLFDFLCFTNSFNAGCP